MTATDTKAAFGDIEGKILLLQLETSKESVIEAMKIAHSRNMTVLLDPGPEQCIFQEASTYADIITPNLREAEKLADMAIYNWSDAKEAAKRISLQGPKR